MTVPTVAQLRRQVQEAVDPLEHPTKPGYHNVSGGTNQRLADKETGFSVPHKYGKMTYREGGWVLVKHDGKYLVARGDDHDDSVWALARRLGFVDYGPDVTVDEVTADEFKRLQTSKGSDTTEQ
jgi:hypothetical protein